MDTLQLSMLFQEYTVSDTTLNLNSSPRSMLVFRLCIVASYSRESPVHVAQQTIYNMVKESQLFYEKHDQDLHGSFTKGGPFYLPIALTSMILHHANIILSHFRERKEN